MRLTQSSVFALALFGALGYSGAVLAQSRPSTTSMSCSQAQATVKSAGAVVLATGGFSYDRYVRSEAFCTHQEMSIPAWAPTLDNALCVIGFVCELRAGRESAPN